jgi:hypothetical protein
MTDLKIPSRGQTATFSVNGVKRGDSMLLLYADELTVVNTRSIGTWVYVLVPAIYLAVHFYLFHTIGWGLVAIWSHPKPSRSCRGPRPGKADGTC